MLTPVSDGPAIVICSTCRYSRDEASGPDGRRGGARLIDILQQLQQTEPAYSAIEVQQMPCLFACTEHCTVHLRAAGKISYVMGRFSPDEEAARAILEYAVRYADSEFGRVPYGQWPEGVKGHFITRMPPPGYVAE